MNIMETTPAKITVNIEGMTWDEVTRLFEDRYGSLMWLNGKAYPAGDISVSIKFNEPAADVAKRSLAV